MEILSPFSLWRKTLSLRSVSQPTEHLAYNKKTLLRLGPSLSGPSTLWEGFPC